MRLFLQNLKHHHAQKDISEALEQFHSSKNLSQAHRAILTNHSIIMALSNRCVKQEWLWQTKKQNKQTLKIQDAPSKTHDMWRIKIYLQVKLTMVVKERQDAFQGIPKLSCLVLLEY